MKSLVYAIVPARSGSKGLPNKNIWEIRGVPLLGYAIKFALKLDIDKVICSTDSVEYAELAKSCGACVPFLRSPAASGDEAMEEHILEDLYEKFCEVNMPIPDIIVWLRPTFVFRDFVAVKEGLEFLKLNSNYTSVRLITEAESRLYRLKNEELFPVFEEMKGVSMVRRQDISPLYRVYNTDIFRFNRATIGPNFLGDKVKGIPVHKICGLDIDDELDFRIVEALILSGNEIAKHYLL